MLYFGETQMDEKRLGEIALLIVKEGMFKSGLPGDGFTRELDNAAKTMGITFEELRQFYEALLPEVLSRLLGRESVTLKTSD